MIEIRVHGRGGQGAVLASKILARGFFITGKYVQCFPFFGVERRGAPVYSSTRVADEPILHRCVVKEPDILLILDPNLALSADTYTGLKEGGTAVINIPPSAAPPAPALNGALYAVDGTDIALRFGLGDPTSPIVSTVMTGAFGKATGYLGPEEIGEAISVVLGKDHRKDTEGARAAYDEVRRYEIR